MSVLGRRWRLALHVASALTVATVGCTVGHAEPRPHLPASARAVDQLIVKPLAGGNGSALKHLPTARIERAFAHLGGIQVIRLPSGLAAKTAIALLRKTGEFEYVEADGVVSLQSTEPNDFRFPGGELWGLHNIGLYGGMPGADIKAPEAWDIRTDASSIIVALVDSGVRQTHEDLAPNLWQNPGEIAGNGVDDDGDGIVDDTHGYNAYLQNGNPEDDLGHGTHVAGIIGAAGNNVVGVVGVAWKVRLLATKFTDPDGNGTISDAIACIDYAREHGARVINASWGAPSFNSVALHDAIARVRDAGILFVTVAGNNHADNDAVPYYPGAYASSLDNIVVVTATDRVDELAFFGNYGATSVHLGAPGYNIFSTWLGSDSDYQYYNGGSMAVAFVSGAAALIMAQYPNETYVQAKQRILTTTDPLPTLAGKTVTGGRLNLFRALSVGTSQVPPPPSLAISGVAVVVTLKDPAASDLTIHFTAHRAGTSTSGTAVIPAGATSVTLPVSAVASALSASITLDADGAYQIGGVTAIDVTPH
jgi:subtilisin family serine protease